MICGSWFVCSLVCFISLLSSPPLWSSSFAFLLFASSLRLNGFGELWCQAAPVNETGKVGVKVALFGWLHQCLACETRFLKFSRVKHKWMHLKWGTTRLLAIIGTSIFFREETLNPHFLRMGAKRWRTRKAKEETGRNERLEGRKEDIKGNERNEEWEWSRWES